MSDIIDVSFACGGHAAALSAAGIRTVFRYYSRDTTLPTKQMTRAEAGQFTASGLRIGVVYEGRRGNQPSNFDHAAGLADAAYSRTYGARTIGQPGGSTIYFAVDFDATATQIRDLITPYFQGVADAWAVATGEPDYSAGVYGSGAVCQAMLDAGLVQRAWLAQSTGWLNSKTFAKTDRWSMKQGASTVIALVDCDPNVAGIGKTIGDFALPIALVPAPAVTTTSLKADAMRVNARHGLNLRAGPGTDFDSKTMLPLGAIVYPLKSIGGWTMVDCEGDGVADGFVSSAYLSNIGGGTNPIVAVPAPQPAANPDAPHISELIRQGSSSGGLKTARETAARALPGYPTNGCAVHLSALLRQAGIDVPMTAGAGNLAHLIAARGWRRVACGNQRPGDIGVTFDNDPTPPGADHIYLVIETLDRDKMMIADNQRTTNSPHVRFASGQGKTPTEYFLRAT